MEYLYKIWSALKSAGFMAFLALFSFGFAIFQTYYFEKKPEITISINSLARVFDVYQSVGKLKIIYANEDLRVSKKQLWSMTVTVSNTGNVGIKKGDFDESVPFGLLFSDVEIVDNPLISTSNSYLEEHVNIKTQRDRILFSPSIIEPQDSFKINVLLLGPQSKTPSVSGIGKIAGIAKFSVATENIDGNKSTWEKITSADYFLIHFYRIFIYFLFGIVAVFAFAIALAILVIPFSMLNDKRTIAKRRAKMSNFLASIDGLDKSENVRRELKTLCNMYIENSEHRLSDIKGVIEQTKERYEFIQKLGCVQDEQLLETIVNKIKPFYPWFITSSAKDKGIISFDGIIPKWSDTLESSLEELAKYLEVDLDKMFKQDSKEFKSINRINNRYQSTNMEHGT